MRVCLAIALGLLAGFAPFAAVAVPAPAIPLRGAITGGKVLACSCPKWWVSVQVADLDRDGPTIQLRCSGSNRRPAQWHVGPGAFWVTASEHPDTVNGHHLELVSRYDLAQLRAGELLPPRVDPKDNDAETIALDKSDLRFFITYDKGPVLPWCEPHWAVCGFASDFPPERHFDWLPDGSDRVRLLLLTNLRGRCTPRGEAGAIAAWSIDQTFEEMRNPKWSLTVHEHTGHWDAKKKAWVDGPWKRGEEITVGFEEPFQALEQDGTYYFVTDSGKLYAAPKATAKGKPRPMKAVWDDKARPLSTFVTDADAGRTFLFTKPGKAGEKAVWFELAEKAAPTEYDPAKLPAAKGDEPLRTVLRHARFLAAASKLKGK